MKGKKKGFASIVSLTWLMFFALFLSVFFTQIGRAFTTKCYSQTIADSIANAVATYSSEGASFNEAKAMEMFNKMSLFHGNYTTSIDRDSISNGKIKISASTAIKYPLGGTFFSLGINSVTSKATVQLASQTQLAKIKGAFPSDKMQPVTPFVTGTYKDVKTNDYVVLDALISQFYTEGRNRYRFSGEQNTVYGPMDAYQLLLGDALTAMNFSPYAEGFETVTGNTSGKMTDKALTDGYIYIADFEGHTYIVSNPKEEDKVSVLFLDATKENGMSIKKVELNDLNNLRRSPEKWYSPKNEEDLNKEQNTKTYF